MSKQCELYAKVGVDGKLQASLLHKKLLSKFKIRQVANLIYATYLSQHIADNMDKDGYLRNFQGEHDIDDVVKYLGFETLIEDLSDASISAYEKKFGVRDNYGNVINYPSSEKALEAADKINKHIKVNGEKLHIVAYPVYNNNTYQIALRAESTDNIFVRKTVDYRLKLWNKIKEAFTRNGLDIEALSAKYPDIITNEPNFVSYLNSLGNIAKYKLSEREIAFLLDLTKDTPQTKELLDNLGDIETAAKLCYEQFTKKSNLGYSYLISKTVETAQKIIGSVIDNDFIKTVNSEYTDTIKFSAESSIDYTFKKLNDKYHIGKYDYEIIQAKSNFLSEINAKAIAVIEKRIKALQSENPKTDNEKETNKNKISELRKNMYVLKKELNTREYIGGLHKFLTEGIQALQYHVNAFGNLKQNGTKLENSLELASLLYSMDYYIDGNDNLFTAIIEDTANLDNIIKDRNISIDEINQLKEVAQQAQELVRKAKDVSRNLKRGTMIDLVSELLRNKISKAEVDTLVDTLVSTGWGTDVLYSGGKVANHLVASIFTMIRDQQDKRNKELGVITRRIRTLNGKLRKAGYTSEFMYRKDGYILSDYDFRKYYSKRGAHKAKLKLDGLKDDALDQAMDEWEFENTDLLLVDAKNNRYERVPKLSEYSIRESGSFRDDLSPEQLEYYDAMMQIKGEMGTLLPEWAQNQFIPPQLRREVMDALIQKDSTLKDVGNALWDKFTDKFLVKADDTELAANGYVDNEIETDLNNVQRKRIPIFFVRKLADQGELLKNFSAGLQAYAAVAENYYYMSEVVDAAEFMRSYIKSNSAAVSKRGNTLKQSSSTSIINIFNKVKDKAGSFDVTIMDDLFDMQLYRDIYTDNPWFAKTVGTITSYTSFKGLSTNVFGAIANLLAGHTQLVEMAVANSLYHMLTGSKVPYFGVSDYIKGFLKLCAEPAKTLTGNSVLLDLMSDNKRSKDYLIAEYFDLFNENYGSMMHTSYRGGLAQYIHDLSFVLYSAGEKAIRYNAMWSMLKNLKCTIDGKDSDMMEAFGLTEDDLNPNLIFKPNVIIDGIVLTDANGNLTPEGDKYLDAFKTTLRSVCQTMFGAMNDEDKGIIHAYALGRVGMNFRQWMVGHYSARFRGKHWDNDLGCEVTGYWTDAYYHMKNILATDEVKYYWNEHQRVKALGKSLSNLKNIKSAFLKEWAKADEQQKLGLMRLISEVGVWMTLLAATLWMGGGTVGSDDAKKKRRKMSPVEKALYYQICRQLFEVESSMPLGAIQNFEQIVQSPLPAIRTIDNSFYFVTGIFNGDIDKTIKSGPDTGMNKYLRNTLKYNLPFWRDYRRMSNLEYNDALFGMFEESAKLK